MTSKDREEAISLLTARLALASKRGVNACRAFRWASALTALARAHARACEDACGSERAPSWCPERHAANGERRALATERRILNLCEEIRSEGGPRKLTARFEHDPRGITVILYGLDKREPRAIGFGVVTP